MKSKGNPFVNKIIFEKQIKRKRKKCLVKTKHLTWQQVTFSLFTKTPIVNRSQPYVITRYLHQRGQLNKFGFSKQLCFYAQSLGYLGVNQYFKPIYLLIYFILLISPKKMLQKPNFLNCPPLTYIVRTSIGTQIFNRTPGRFFTLQVPWLKWY